MKRLILALLVLLVASRSYGQSTTPLPLPADRIITADITSTSCPADVTSTGCVVINTQGTSTISVSIRGAWQTFVNGIQTNFLVFQATISDSGGWTTIGLVNSVSLLSESVVSNNGNFISGIGGYRKFRVIIAGSAPASAAHIILNASAGQSPKTELSKSAPLAYSLPSGSNSIGAFYTVSNCTNLKHVQFSINADGANAIVANINISNTVTGPWVNYKKMNIGLDVPAIFNGEISAPFFQIAVNENGATAGNITIQGGCN